MPIIIPPGVNPFGGGTVKTSGRSYSVIPAGKTSGAGQPFSGGSSRRPSAGGGGNPLIDAMLGLLGQGGGGGGGGGYGGWDGSAARAAALAPVRARPVY